MIEHLRGDSWELISTPHGRRADRTWLAIGVALIAFWAAVTVAVLSLS